eukprot:UN03120
MSKHAFTEVMNCLARNGMVNEVEKLFEHVDKSVVLNQHILTNAYANAGNVEKLLINLINIKLLILVLYSKFSICT